MAIGPFVQPLVTLALLAFWIYCLVDALREDRSWIWIALLAFIPVLSAFAYFLNFKAFGAPSRGLLDGWYGDSARLRELQKQARELDVPGVNREIADIYFRRGDYNEALATLKRVLDQDGEDLRSQYQAGVCMTVLGKPEAAIPHLEFVLDQDARYGFGDAHLAMANAFLAVGENERAFDLYTHVVENFNVPEAVVRYARMLMERGERDRAQLALRTMLGKVGSLLPEDLARHRPWIRKAAEDLRALEKS